MEFWRFILINFILLILCNLTLGVNNEHLEGTTTVPPCFSNSVDKFPPDFFTQQQRLNGGIVLHFLLVLYLCSVSAIISEYYSIPSLELTVHYCGFPPDIGSAIILPLATSSGELFACIIGSFIALNHVGVGTIIGTSVFNLLGFTAVSAFSLKRRHAAFFSTDGDICLKTYPLLYTKKVPVDWYPITRDCLLYTGTLLIVIWFLMDEVITWWEAVILTALFILYVIIVYFNRRIEKAVKTKIPRLNSKCGHEIPQTVVDNEDGMMTNFGRATLDICWINAIEDSHIQEPTNQPAKKLQMPKENIASQIWWIIMWPANILLSFTIPNCRKQKFRKIFPLTFLISFIWIGGITYLSIWMVTIISYTFKIPIPVAGVTILAVGASIPQIMFGIMGIRKISGEKVITNQLQNNIFGILLCLGIPWLIKCLIMEDRKITINTKAMFYTFLTLLSVVVIIWIFLIIAGWKLSWKFGTACLILYIVFIILVFLYELNILGHFRPPLCFP